ncbi:MAG TPA: DMT family transporter [Planctomycetota bacterium]|nr:DMT family transporter [Planctomycetota bacterium]
MKIPPRAALATFVLAIGWAGPLFRLAHVPFLLASGARVAIATAILLPFFGGEAFRVLLERPRVALRAFAAGALLALHFAFWVRSLDFTTIAAATLLVTTEPLFAAALETAFLRERLPRRLVLGVVVALAGSAVACAGDFGSLGTLEGRALLGDLLALGGSGFAAAYMVIGRSVRASMPLGGYLVLVNSVAATLLLGASALFGESWSVTPATFGWLALLALVPHLLGHGSANVALRSYPATVVNVAVLGEPFLASLLAFALFDERPGVWLALGAPLLVAGLWLAVTSAPEPAPAKTR